MKWIAISGSWRHTPLELIKDLKCEVKSIFDQGNGIVTGGALGVDFLATNEFLSCGAVDHLKIVLPTSLEIYSQHYLQRANEGVITHQQAKGLINQLQQVKISSPQSLIENLKTIKVTQDNYYQRNSQIIKLADELIAFQVNKSLGTQDTMDKAKQRGIRVRVFEYEVKE